MSTELIMDCHNNTNNEHDGHKHMMWMMVICCALPLLALLFLTVKWMGMWIS